MIVRLTRHLGVVLTALVESFMLDCNVTELDGVEILVDELRLLVAVEVTLLEGDGFESEDEV